MDVKPHILLRLNGDSKQFSDERGLAWCFTFVYSLHLPFPDHCAGYIEDPFEK
jgi:hypothetical protein